MTTNRENYLRSLTDTQLVRQFNRLLRRIYRAFAGGTRFGIDLPTLWLCCPGFYDAYQAYRAEDFRRAKIRWPHIADRE